MKKKPPNSSDHTPQEKLVLKLGEDIGKKVSRMNIKIEGKPCTILLDSCASTGIVSTNFVKNYLEKEASEVYGPSIIIRGIGDKSSNALGYIDLNLEIFEKIYKEKFIIMNNPGIPGDILMSMGAMGRCGLIIDFEERIIKSKHTGQEIAFLSGESDVRANLASLQDSGESKGKILYDCNQLSDRNAEQYHPQKLKRYYQYKRNKDSALIQQSKNFNENNCRNKTNQHPNPENIDCLQRFGDCLEGNGKDKRNDLNTVDNLENNSRIFNVVQQVNEIQRNEELEKKEENFCRNVPQVKGCFPVLGVENKTLTEVLHLGTIPMTGLDRIIDEDEKNKETEYAYFVGNNQKEENVYCVSPNDDYLVKFRVNCGVSLLPAQCTRVSLNLVDSDIDLNNKELILQTCRETPADIKMDQSLVRLIGTTCNVYIYNHSNLRIDLQPGQLFCEGIILEHPLIGITESAFCAITGLEDDEKLSKELKQVDFPQAQTELITLLKKYRNIVALSGEKLGGTNVGEHKILLEPNAKAFFIPNYRLPISRREIIEEMVKDMKADGIVRDSKSPYNSPLLLVPKKDNTWRLVIDYRRLNQQTIPDRFPMPVINDVLAQLGGAKVFSSLDLLSGYWQIPMAEESKPLTAFSTHKEHLEFNCMPFGLTSAPLTFSRIIGQVLGHIKNVYIYLDDVIIFSEDLESHLATLEEVLQSFQKAGLKIKFSKCQFLKEELEYLGHKVNANGILMQEGKIKAMVDYPPPVNVKSLRRFLGMIGYYRPFIQNFSTIAHPLTELLKKDNTFSWGEEQNQAFQTLKNCLMKEPILVYPDFKEEFYLATDASSTGLGAVLMQKRKSRMRVISYASRVMNDTEKRYSVTERECLALFWGLKKFKHLILGYKVNILTDHKPLLDLYKKREFINNSKFNRWFLAILEFSPEIKYIPGTANNLADGLSRKFEETESKVIDRKYCFTCRVVELDMTIVKMEQEKDSDIRNIMSDKLEDQSQRPEFEICNGIVYKKPGNESESLRLYVPKTLIREVLNLTHSHKMAGHPGQSKTQGIIRRNYYWPGCTKDVEQYIKSCHVCNVNKGNVNVPAPLERYPTELYPFQVVSMDFVGPMTTTYNGNKYLLVFVDYLTRWVEIVPCANRLASTVAEAFKSRILVQHSTPEVLLSDNAPEFTGEIMQKLCDYFEVRKVQTTPYKPSSNGAVERANQKVKNLLKTLVTPTDVDWDKYIDLVQMVINNSVNSSTGETPHYILYGYDKRLPFSLCDDAKPPRKIYNYESYIEDRMNKYFHIVRRTRDNLKKSQKLWEENYKSKEKRIIKKGARVYVLKNVIDGPNVKMSQKFEGPFRVVEVKKGNKFEVIHETQLFKRIVHYNKIKVINIDDIWFQNPEELNEVPNENEASDPSVPHRYNLRTRD